MIVDTCTCGAEFHAGYSGLHAATDERFAHTEWLAAHAACRGAAADVNDLAAEITRLRTHILELETELAAGVHTCGPTCRKTQVCAELADLREAIRVCLVYWLGGDSPDDCPHTVARLKSLCDWYSTFDAARSAP